MVGYVKNYAENRSFCVFVNRQFEDYILLKPFTNLF